MQEKGLSKMIETVALRVMGFSLDLARIALGNVQFKQFSITLKDQTYSLIDQAVKSLYDAGYILETEYNEYVERKKEFEANKYKKEEK